MMAESADFHDERLEARFLQGPKPKNEWELQMSELMVRLHSPQELRPLAKLRQARNERALRGGTG